MRPTRTQPLLVPSRLDRALWLGLVVVLVAGLAGCGQPDEDAGPSLQLEMEPLAGSYAVTSRFAVPATVAAPGPLGDALRLLHALDTDPGAALLDLAEQAGAPAVSELRFVLPDALESRLTGWMNGYLDGATVGGVSPHGRVAELDALVRSVLLRYELRSTLELPDGAPGTHTPLALAFEGPSGPVVIPVDATAPVTAGTGVTAVRARPAGLPEPVQVIVGEHAMGIPFGHYALSGLDALLEAELGAADLRAALADAVGCAALAADVADRCLGPVCVGHEGTLRDVCEAGVDEAAAQLEAQLLALDYRALHFTRGTALEGTDGTLGGGTWEVTVDLGNGAEAATATFTATP